MQWICLSIYCRVYWLHMTSKHMRGEKREKKKKLKKQERTRPFWVKSLCLFPLNLRQILSKTFEISGKRGKCLLEAFVWSRETRLKVVGRWRYRRLQTRMKLHCASTYKLQHSSHGFVSLWNYQEDSRDYSCSTTFKGKKNPADKCLIHGQEKGGSRWHFKPHHPLLTICVKRLPRHYLFGEAGFMSRCLPTKNKTTSNESTPFSRWLFVWTVSDWTASNKHQNKWWKLA